MRKYVVAREAIRKKSNGKTFQKRPKIQRLVTPLTLQRKRHMYGSRCAVLSGAFVFVGVPVVMYAHEGSSRAGAPILLSTMSQL